MTLSRVPEPGMIGLLVAGLGLLVAGLGLIPLLARRRRPTVV